MFSECGIERVEEVQVESIVFPGDSLSKLIHFISERVDDVRERGLKKLVIRKIYADSGLRQKTAALFTTQKALQIEHLEVGNLADCCHEVRDSMLKLVLEILNSDARLRVIKLYDLGLSGPDLVKSDLVKILDLIAIINTNTITELDLSQNKGLWLDEIVQILK